MKPLVRDLAAKYMDQIKISSATFEPADDANYDPACLYLIIPTSMLDEYTAIRKLQDCPRPKIFWGRTRLLDALIAGKNSRDLRNMSRTCAEELNAVIRHCINHRAS